MFEFLRGIVVEAAPTKVVLDVGNIGYGVHISLRTYEKIPALKEVITLHVTLIVKEDEHALYGFISPQEKMLFQQLITVSGIGPKTALSILGHIEMGDFQTAIMQANVPLLSKVPGIGLKTAQRLILELKDKMHKMSKSDIIPSALDAPSSHLNDAVSALIHLGYHPAEAQKRVKKVISTLPENFSLSDLISLALSAS
ncbi:Holliday junction branch migration protein RuvA [Rhabdochlamydiaceae symbiont of Dictyostelium giganteum]|uniref:Holliday junction branch migration protein RuvA n=1 Tax=Rhabdochlamydiaceae symbiont of Dictyostelium giganteum TaxID=3342349 RepID=UPI00385151C4